MGAGMRAQTPHMQTLNQLCSQVTCHSSTLELMTSWLLQDLVFVVVVFNVFSMYFPPHYVSVMF